MEPNKNNSGTSSLFGQTSGAGGLSSFSFSSSSTTPQSSPAKPSTSGVTSTVTTGGSLFGNTSNNTTASTGSLFGNTGNNTTASTGSLFGNTGNNTTASTAPAGNTATSSTSKSSIFGGAVSNSAPSIFGGAISNSTASPSIFGAATNTSATGTATPTVFSSLSSNAGNPNPAGSSPSINLNANQPSKAPQSTGLFGAKPQTSNNNLFSNSSSTTNTGTTSAAPNSTTNATSTPAFSFGLSSNNVPSKDAGTTQPSIFGGITNKETSAQAAASPTTNTNLFGSKQTDSSSLNKAPSSAAANSTTTTTNSSASPFTASLPSKPTGGLFGVPAGNSNTGGFSMKSSTAPTKSSPLATNSTTNSAGGGESNSQTTSTTLNTSKPTTSTSPATPSSTSNTNNTNSKPNINLAPSLLKGKTLEDLVSRWNSELDERVEDFKLTANEIAAWDQVLIQNGDQISALNEELQRIDPIQSSIDQTLDYVETQQSELSAALDDYERQLTSQQAGGVMDITMMTGGNNRIRTAGQEREEAYKTAEEVHAQLNDMAGSLGTMIAELNSLAGPANRIDESSLVDGNNFSSSSNTNIEDPIVQISGILNAHLGSLNWISEITNELGSKIFELESRISNTKLEFGLETNSNNNFNKQSSSDIDDLNNLSLVNNFTNHHNLNSSAIQGYAGMRNLSNGHPRR